MGFRYEVGCSYPTQDGKDVRVVERKARHVGYETVLGDDGRHRYDRSTSAADAGRVTGTAHDYSDPGNFARADRPVVAAG